MPFPSIPGSVLILISCLSSALPTPPTHTHPPFSPSLLFQFASLWSHSMFQSWKADVSRAGRRHTAAPDSLASLRLESNFILVTLKEHMGFEMGALRAVSWPDCHSHETPRPISPRCPPRKAPAAACRLLSSSLRDAGALASGPDAFPSSLHDTLLACFSESWLLPHV